MTAGRPRVLIAGATGFTGRHLAAWCLAQGAQVFGVARPGRRALRGVTMVRGDWRQALDVQRAVRRVRPQYVMHLIAWHDNNDAAALFAHNIASAWHVLRAVRRHAPAAKVLLVGSAAQYGEVARAAQPVSESHALQPVTAYGLSKMLQEDIGLRAWREWGVAVYVVRTFNLLGPGQPPGFVAADVLARVRRVPHAARATTLRVAQPTAHRDFVDVRDAVRAYWAILRHGRPGRPYNVCSGEAVSIARLAQLAARVCGVRVRVATTAGRATARSAGVTALCGSPRRLQRELHWRPRYSVEQSLRDMAAGTAHTKAATEVYLSHV